MTSPRQVGREAKTRKFMSYADCVPELQLSTFLTQHRAIAITEL